MTGRAYDGPGECRKLYRLSLQLCGEHEQHGVMIYTCSFCLFCCLLPGTHGL